MKQDKGRGSEKNGGGEEVEWEKKGKGTRGWKKGKKTEVCEMGECYVRCSEK